MSALCPKGRITADSTAVAERRVMIHENSSAIFALIGVVVGAVFTGVMAILRDHLNNKSKIRLEKMRLHDKESRDAHKRLFVFSQKLSNKVWVKIT